MAASYCDFVKGLEKDNLHRDYHDHHYGFPLTSDNELFGRFLLEIFQAGLSWETILKKQASFRKAFANFDVKKVAGFNDDDIARLLSDSGIVRNRLKINAAIQNANMICAIQKEYGSFGNWIDMHQPRPLDEWVKLFKKTFRFVGNEIVNEFLMSTGYLPGAHKTDCPVYKKIEKSNPPFLKILNHTK